MTLKNIVTSIEVISRILGKYLINDNVEMFSLETHQGVKSQHIRIPFPSALQTKITDEDLMILKRHGVYVIPPENEDFVRFFLF